MVGADHPAVRGRHRRLPAGTGHTRRWRTWCLGALDAGPPCSRSRRARSAWAPPAGRGRRRTRADGAASVGGRRLASPPRRRRALSDHGHRLSGWRVTGCGCDLFGWPPQRRTARRRAGRSSSSSPGTVVIRRGPAAPSRPADVSVRSIRILAVTVFLEWLGATAIVPMLPVCIRQLGGTDGLAGLVMARSSPPACSSSTRWAGCRTGSAASRSSSAASSSTRRPASPSSSTSPRPWPSCCVGRRAWGP